MRIGRVLTIVTVVTAALACSRLARAETVVPPKADIASVLDDGQRLVLAALSGNAPSARTPAAIEPADPAALPPLVDLAPRASVLVRDWQGSLRLTGGRTLLVDDLRPSGSMRLVMVRVASDARLSPFVQAGAGQWRVDPVMFPNMDRLTSYAGQVAAGFELRSGPLSLGGEAQYNVLYREALPDASSPRFLAVMVAARSVF